MRKKLSSAILGNTTSARKDQSIFHYHESQHRSDFRRSNSNSCVNFPFTRFKFMAWSSLIKSSLVFKSPSNSCNYYYYYHSTADTLIYPDFAQVLLPKLDNCDLYIHTVSKPKLDHLVALSVECIPVKLNIYSIVIKFFDSIFSMSTRF